MAHVHSRRIFSGIQPTGSLHLGNYIGAVRNWVRIQSEATNGASTTVGGVHANSIAPSSLLGTAASASNRRSILFSIVDLHAMTMPYKSAELENGVREMAAALLACGIDPKQSIIFVQSHVREHAELAWLLSCLSPLGWLQRMTQFKQKSGKDKAASPLGLLSYPVLQAADVLLYKATHVPVGEDQHQHIELCRDVAISFNHRFGSPSGGDATASSLALDTPNGGVTGGTGSGILPLPQTLSLPVGARVMSLKDGSKKMSKSDPVDDSRINLSDAPDVIVKKIRGAKTDTQSGFLPIDAEKRPDKHNLLSIYSALSGEGIEAIAARYVENGCEVRFKSDLADLTIQHVAPIGTRMKELRDDRLHLDAVLKEGGDAAREIAASTMTEIRALTGYR